MRSEDEAGLQRSIEHMEQMSDEELRKSLSLNRSKLEDQKSHRELLKAKMINNRSGYRGYSSDRIVLVNLSHQIDYRTRLADTLQRILEARQDPALSAEAVHVTIHNTSIDNTIVHNTTTQNTTNYNTAIQVNVVKDAPKKSKPPKPPSERDLKIYPAIEKKLKKEAYARAVHEAGVRICKKWKDDGCPSTYPKAYEVGKPWTTKISKEKSAIKKRVEAFQKFRDSSE